MGGRLYNVEVGKIWVSNTDALQTSANVAGLKRKDAM